MIAKLYLLNSILNFILNGPSMKPNTIFLLILIALVAIILLQNMETVFIRLLFWSVSAPLLVFLLAALFIGLGAGWFTHWAYFKGKYSHKSRSEAGPNN